MYIMIVVGVQKDEPVEDRVAKEPEGGDRDRARRIRARTCHPQRFGQKIEKGGGKNGTGAESKDEMQPVAQPERQRPARECRRRRAKREDQDE